MKKLTFILSSLLLCATLSAQSSKIPVILDIASVEENDEVTAQVVNIPSEGQNHYFLNLGNMGFGDSIIQIDLDPVYFLYIPLGDNLTDAIAKLEQIRTLCSMKKGESTEIEGTFSPLFPDENIQPITVTRYKPTLGKKLQFSIQKDGYIRATYLSKMDLSSLISTVKLYKKMHKKEA